MVGYTSCICFPHLHQRQKLLISSCVSDCNIWWLLLRKSFLLSHLFLSLCCMIGSVEKSSELPEVLFSLSWISPEECSVTSVMVEGLSGVGLAGYSWSTMSEKHFSYYERVALNFRALSLIKEKILISIKNVIFQTWFSRETLSSLQNVLVKYDGISRWVYDAMYSKFFVQI